MEKIIKADLEDLTKELWLRMREQGIIVWQTRDGKLIPIKDMTLSHLCNTINYINNKEEQREQYLEALGSIGDMWI